MDTKGHNFSKTNMCSLYMIRCMGNSTVLLYLMESVLLPALRVGTKCEEDDGKAWEIAMSAKKCCRLI